MSTPNEEHLLMTLAFWQQRTRRTLTLEDAREIAETMAGFFEALLGAGTEEIPSPAEGGDL